MNPAAAVAAAAAALEEEEKRLRLIRDTEIKLKVGYLSYFKSQWCFKKSQ